MKKLSILLAILAIGLAASAAFAQDEKELVIKTAHALETDPLDPQTVSMRERALKWVIETDQVHLIACGGVFDLYSNKKNKNAPDMTVAYTIGMAAFKLENPEKATDENAAQLAGLELALKTYEAIVKVKPKNKFDAIEALLVKRNNGELAALVAAADCGKK